jgi:hypothetical protein
MDSATYDVYFSTTTQRVSELSTDPTQNIGSDYKWFGTYSLGGTLPNVLTLYGEQPYVYDPAQGNLLMDVIISDPTVIQSQYYAYLQADWHGVTTSRFWSAYLLPVLYPQYVSSANGTDAGALVTRFNSPEPATIPEPAALVVWLVLGSLGITAMLRPKQEPR